MFTFMARRHRYSIDKPELQDLLKTSYRTIRYPPLKYFRSARLHAQQKQEHFRTFSRVCVIDRLHYRNQ